MIPVEGHKNLFRDPETGAILNNDSKIDEIRVKR